MLITAQGGFNMISTTIQTNTQADHVVFVLRNIIIKIEFTGSKHKIKFILNKSIILMYDHVIFVHFWSYKMKRFKY